MPVSPSFAYITRRLLRGPIYSDQDRDWQALTEHLAELHRYFSRMELRVVVQNTDGYAFLDDGAHPSEEDETAAGATEQLPSLLRRDKLTYDTTLLCVLLRQRLDYHDAAGTASSGGRCYVTEQELYDSLDPFFKDDTNQIRRNNRLKKCVADTVHLGFLTVARTYADEDSRTQYEVKRILKARIDNDQLEDFQRQLGEYIAAHSVT